MTESKGMKSIRKQLVAAIAMFLVAAIALGSSTYAWFVSNTKVQANMSSVTATSATPNLLIVNGATSKTAATVTGGGTVATLASTDPTALYPASTDDCTTWYAVDSWTATGGVSKADGYYNPTITAPATTGIADGVYKQGDVSYNAYQVATYSVYTTTGTVDLCLDPVDPITVNVTAGDLEGTGFKDSLRVGIVVNGTLKVVYAPTAETTGTGNDNDAVAGYRTVASATATKAATYTTIAGTTFTGWTATDVGGGNYTKATNTFGQVTTTGAVVQVYVWLEGTDAQCLVGSADASADDATYGVTLNFVGAAVQG